MADVITRFKLETTQYNSKLRDAAKGLNEFVRVAENGGKGFINFSQKSIEAARALGTVASGANNLKDKVKDLVGAYNDAAKAYNKLSQEQQQSDFGKALAQSIGQLSDRIKEAKQELYGLGNAAEQVKSKTGGLFGEGGLTGMLAVTGGNLLASGLTKLGSELADTVQQSIELAKSGEGVRLAFERLNRPDLLANLKEATHGTVSELELMKAAVKFDDFKLPVEQLGTLLAFAQKKAKDTGQSVDYMVDSIVTGLGRKSLMILDNLGLSAAQINERMAETGDMTKAVADIIKEQMSEAGEYVETAADRAARAAADAQNQMEDLGRKAMPVAEQWASTWAIIKMGALDLLNNAVIPLINALTEAGRLRAAQQDRGSSGRIAQQISWLQNPGSEGKQSVYERITDSYVDEINHARTEYNKLQKDAVWNPFAAWNADKALAKLNVIKQEYADFKAQAASIMNPKNEVVIKTDNAQRDIDSLKRKLRELQADYRAAIKAGDTAKSNDLLKQINQTKKDIRGLNPNALKTTGTTKTPKTEEQLNNEQIGKLTQEYIKASQERQAAIRDEIKTLQDRNNVIQQLKDEALGKAKIGGISAVEGATPMSGENPLEKYKDSAIGLVTPLQQLQNELKNLQALQAAAWSPEVFAAYQQRIEEVQGKINVFKGIQKDANASAKSFQAAAGAISSVGSALSSIEDPSAKIFGIVAQAIATIANAFASALGSDKTTKGNIWAFIGASAASMTAMAAAIAQIHSATGYANGGEIKGNSYSGDNIPIMANAGEIILNKSQQATLASNLQGSDGGGYKPSYITGEMIWIAANRYTKRTGRGELVTWK